MTSVVIIDDEIDLVEAIQEYLETMDIQVVACGINGQEAIELCIKHSPDFLILDLAMPKYDGIYTLEKLLEKNSPIKVIVMTGLMDKDQKLTLSKFKIHAKFLKPTNPKILVDVIKNN